VSDILSQSEIDALLSALTSGEIDADEIREADESSRVRNYDFRRAMRFSKDHIRIIARIHDSFARLVTTHLSAQLRSVVQVQVESVDQVPYEEFIHSIPQLTVIQVMEFDALNGKLVVEMNPQIVFAMLDRLMGGMIGGPYKERELTEIETALVNRVLSGMPQQLSEAWKNVIAMTPEKVSTESNPQFLQLTTPNETVLVITLSAKIGNNSGLLNVCIPHMTIEPVMSRLSTQYFMDAGRTSHQHQEEVRRLNLQLRNADVDVSVELGQTELSFVEVMELQVGDIIPLQAPVHQPLTVYVNQVPTYTGGIGTSKKHYAVQIMDDWKVVQEDERRDEIITG
jgi:flagellar motor switch protein FliM